MGRKKAGRLHGVEVSRRATNGPRDRRAGQVLIRRICVRYEDGRRVCFVPERGRSSSPKTTRTGWSGCCTSARRPLSGGRQGRGGIPARGHTTPAPCETSQTYPLSFRGLLGGRTREEPPRLHIFPGFRADWWRLRVNSEEKQCGPKPYNIGVEVRRPRRGDQHRRCRASRSREASFCLPETGPMSRQEARAKAGARGGEG